MLCHRRSLFLGFRTAVLLALFSAVAFAGGTPDHGASTLTVDRGDAETGAADTSLQAAVIGAAKRVSSAATSNGDGTFTVDLELVVENLGSEDLVAIQVADDLSATFPAPASVVSVSPPVATITGGMGALSANTAYDGLVDTDLLVAAVSGLDVGASGRITMEVTFDPNGLPGPFFNQSTASGSPPGGGTVSDLSDDGSDPDPDGDGNPGEAGENDPTPIPIIESPAILVTKSASAPSQVSGDVHDVTFTVVTQNTGDVDLTISSVVDDLTAAFSAPGSPVGVQAGPSVANAAGATLASNGGFDGSADTNLVTAGGSLPVAASSTITFTARFDTGGTTGPFVNGAAVNGTSPQSASVQDSGSASVTVPFVENPGLRLDKSLSSITQVASGSYDVVFVLDIENTGNVDLQSLQITDLLPDAFPGATVGSSTLACQAGSCGNLGLQYTGPADPTLLNAASSSLPEGQSATLRLEAEVTPSGGAGPFTNTATASAESPSATPLQDTDAAQVSLPVIGLAKEVIAGPTSNGDGTFTVDLELVVENLGREDLVDVRVIDDLSATFPAPASVVSVSPPVGSITGGTGALSANAAYDGLVDTDLLVTALSSLDAGASGRITVEVTFDPADLTVLENSATARANSASGSTLDVSDEGSTTDADGDGSANEAGENDPTTIFVASAPAIPTADGRGLLALTLLLAGLGVLRLRRAS